MSTVLENKVDILGATKESVSIAQDLGNHRDGDVGQ